MPTWFRFQSDDSERVDIYPIEAIEHASYEGHALTFNVRGHTLVSVKFGENEQQWNPASLMHWLLAGKVVDPLRKGEFGITSVTIAPALRGNG